MNTEQVTCVATKARGGIPVFRMSVLAQKPCDQGGPEDDEHLQFQVVDPEGVTDWVCSKDVDVLESKPHRSEEDEHDDEERTSDSDSSIPSSGRMVVDELKWRKLNEKVVSLRAEVKQLKALQDGAHKKRKTC
jgi:hypothetical protein